MPGSDDEQIEQRSLVMANGSPMRDMAATDSASQFRVAKLAQEVSGAGLPELGWCNGFAS